MKAACIQATFEFEIRRVYGSELSASAARISLPRGLSQAIKAVMVND